jgi:hypothetical protein
LSCAARGYFESKGIIPVGKVVDRTSDHVQILIDIINVAYQFGRTISHGLCPPSEDQSLSIVVCNPTPCSTGL